MEADFLLIGGGLASAFNADTLRKEGVKGKIVILSAENNLPYLRPQLPKAFLLGKRKQEQLLIFSESYYQKNDIDNTIKFLNALNNENFAMKFTK